MFVRFLSEIKEPKASELGGKGYSLAVLMNNGFNVPKGFVIVLDAFFEHLKKNELMEKVRELVAKINEGNFQKKSREIKELILSGAIPEEIALEVKNVLNKLNVQYVSVRSSAVSEDSLKASSAGMHDTFLNVKSEPKQVLENVKKCWASLFNERAIIYRIKKKLPHLEGMAVVVQEMIPAEVSGVAFTAHPTNKKFLLIEACYGIGDMVVGGKVEPDDYVVNRETLEIIERKIGRKDRMSVIENGKIKVIDVEKKLAEKQVLSDNEIKEIAETCLKVEKTFKYPQDIEWCISKDFIWILQSRTITATSLLIGEKTKIKPILSGLGASPGIVKGKVKIILSPREVNKMNDGEILVTVMTNPLYVTAIQKAKGIVTDVGGILSHAAIVARELGIPCVVGTEKATKILKDNMEVIVNGTEGKVYAPD